MQVLSATTCLPFISPHCRYIEGVGSGLFFDGALINYHLNLRPKPGYNLLLLADGPGPEFKQVTHTDRLGPEFEQVTHTDRLGTEFKQVTHADRLGTEFKLVTHTDRLRTEFLGNADSPES
jgi:hypothetical protein